MQRISILALGLLLIFVWGCASIRNHSATGYFITYHPFPERSDSASYQVCGTFNPRTTKKQTLIFGSLPRDYPPLSVSISGRGASTCTLQDTKHLQILVNSVTVNGVKTNMNKILSYKSVFPVLSQGHTILSTFIIEKGERKDLRIYAKRGDRCEITLRILEAPDCIKDSEINILIGGMGR